MFAGLVHNLCMEFIVVAYGQLVALLFYFILFLTETGKIILY